MANALTRIFAGLGLALVMAASGGVTAQTTGPAATVKGETPFVITYRAGPKWKPGVAMRDQGLRDHFYYMKSLDQRGRIVVAGQLGPDGGLVVLRAKDQADADQIVAADPAVTAGIFSGEARPFVPRFVGKPLAIVAP